VVEKLDPVINNPKLQKHIETRARMAEATGGYGDYFMFLPYQFRCRARVNLARKASDPEAALKLAQGAVADLEESVRRGVAPSEEFLKTAKAELEKAKAATSTVKPPDPPPVAEDPAAKLRASLLPLLSANKFKSARAVVDKDKDVPAPERARIAEEVDRRCRTLLNEELFNFRRRFARLETLEEITEISDGAFDTLFSLPAPDEISVAEATYDWARGARAAFKEVHARKAGGESLLPVAAAAAGLDDALYFSRTEMLAYQGVLAGVRARSEKSQDLPKAERDGLQAQAGALAALYTKDFVGKLDPAFAQKTSDLKTHAAELENTLSSFPKDLPQLASIDLEAPLLGKSVEADLLKLESELRALEARPGVSIESRRTLYASLVTVGALRALLAGKDEDAAAADVRAWGAKLAAAGGAADTKRFGPRVEKVFEKAK
jgi:hypothetical protein